MPFFLIYKTSRCSSHALLNWLCISGIDFVVDSRKSSQIEIILKFKLVSVQIPTFKYILEKRRYQKQQIYSFGTSWFIFRSKYKETMLCPQSSFCNSSVLWSAQRPDHAAYLKVLRSYPTKKSHVSDLATTWLLFKGAMLLARSFESYTSGQS